MRRRLVISTIAIVLVVLGALAAPVGIIVYNVAEDQLLADLDTSAAQIEGAIATQLSQGRPLD